MIAEKCYEDEISFIGNRYTLLENKYKATSVPLEKPIRNKIEFLLSGTISKEYCSEAVRYLNQLCEYGGDLPVAELKRGHVEHWIEIHKTWRSPATQRNAISIVLAAFNHAQEMHDIPNPIRGIKKPPARPRLHSLSPEEESTVYEAAGDLFGDFLFAAVHTGLRPFCELARMTAGDVVETDANRPLKMGLFVSSFGREQRARTSS